MLSENNISMDDSSVHGALYAAAFIYSVVGAYSRVTRVMDHDSSSSTADDPYWIQPGRTAETSCSQLKRREPRPDLTTEKGMVGKAKANIPEELPNSSTAIGPRKQRMLFAGLLEQILYAGNILAM